MRSAAHTMPVPLLLLGALAACGTASRSRPIPAAPTAPADAAPGQVRTVRSIALDQPATGQHTRTDPRLSANRAYHLWLFTSDADQSVLIEMSASGANAYLILQAPGGGELARDDNRAQAGTATLRYAVRAGTRYRILAASRRSNRFGSYTLQVTRAPPERVRQISIGQEATDRLTSADPRIPTNRPSHTWRFLGTPGQRVVIEMLSTTVNPYLILQDSGGTELARDNDGGDGNNALLGFTLPSTGEFRILANGYIGNRYGPYTLRLTEAPPERVRQLAFGQEVSDRLTSLDPRIPSNRASHTWRFTGNAGQRVVVEMSSSTVDPHVILQDFSGKELARNDDGGEGLNARLVHTLPSAGTYRIVANNVRARQYGSYTLRLTEAPPERVRRIAMGQEATDQLTRDDPRVPTNRAAHTWRLAGTAGQFVMIEMLSSAVDPHLILQDSAGIQLARNDDGGEGNNARLRYTLPATGEFLILASSYRANAFGDYTLRVTPGTAPATNTEGVCSTIARGQTHTDALSTSDATRTAPTLTRIVDQTGRLVRIAISQRQVPFRAYLYRARAGESLTIDLHGSAIDAMVLVQEADGTALANDDDGGEGLDARLSYVFPYTGTFRIVATTSVGTTTGNYRLSVH